MIEIYKEFVFDSAHWLPNVPEGHKCKNLHGHTYHLKIVLRGEVGKQDGWVADFGDIKATVNKVLKMVDHKLINEVDGLENPTCELFCMWWFKKLKSSLPELVRVELSETPTSGAIYEPKT